MLESNPFGILEAFSDWMGPFLHEIPAWTYIWHCRERTGNVRRNEFNKHDWRGF